MGDASTDWLNIDGIMSRRRWLKGSCKVWRDCAEILRQHNHEREDSKPFLTVLRERAFRVCAVPVTMYQ